MAEQKGVGGHLSKDGDANRPNKGAQGDKGPAWPVTCLTVRTKRKSLKRPWAG